MKAGAEGRALRRRLGPWRRPRATHASLRGAMAGVIGGFVRSFTGLGLILGALFFAASLTPSLVPRPFYVQGVLGGVAFAAGYGAGVAVRALWRWLELPAPTPRLHSAGLGLAGAAALVVVVAALSRAAEWQNGLRALMGLGPVEATLPVQVAVIACATFLVVLLIARLFAWMADAVANWIGRVAPRRVAVAVALGLTASLFWAIGDGVLVASAFRAADASYQALDALIEDESPRPTDPLKTGAPGSLLDWEGLGRTGRAAIAAGPDRAEIEALTGALTGAPALEPLRVYVGLNSAETMQRRATLALAELIRIGAFERSNLVIATPTGTGWLDPASREAMEILLHGDVATVSVQYSYLPSWLALLVDPAYGVETARAVFEAVYGHWTTLPHDARPRLYLHGLSLGSLNSDLSTDLFRVIADPLHGALWAGPPFASRTWSLVTASRNPDTPAWRPEFRDGSLVRFTGQENMLHRAPADWGPVRVIYLQHASDAVTFFDENAAWRPPAWMAPPRGPDVSPDFRWIPVVTFLQLLVDLMTATATPIGHGHVYAFEDYADAWFALTDPPGWTPEAVEALKAKVAAR